jgi:hypothetical protein
LRKPFACSGEMAWLTNQISTSVLAKLLIFDDHFRSYM